MYYIYITVLLKFTHMTAGVTCAGVTCAGVTCAGVTCAGVTCAGVTCAGINLILKFPVVLLSMSVNYSTFLFILPSPMVRIYANIDSGRAILDFIENSKTT